MAKRLTSPFLQHILQQFNDGQIDRAEASLDLHLALHLRRRVNADHQIDFLGRSWPIAPTQRATITLIHHPLRQFWAVTQPPLPPQNTWPEILGNYSL